MKNSFIRCSILVVSGLAMSIAMTACSLSGFSSPTPTRLPSLTATQTSTHTLTYTATMTSTATVTPTASSTWTATLTPTITMTPTITLTPTITPTPTFDFPDGVVNVGQANCRYGPGKAYIYSHGLYGGDHVEVHGRNDSGTWLWVKPDNLDRRCWAAASVFDLSGDVMRVTVHINRLPQSSFVHPPSGVETSRADNQLTISWDEASYIPVGDRRGYLLEVYTCQNGAYFWQAIHTDGSSITIQDDQDCPQASSGLLYIAEKHGYSSPVTIPWK